MKRLLIACVALCGCGGQATFIDLEVTLADGAPMPSTLSVSVFDEYGARLDGVATKNAILPRLVHIDASTLDDRTHDLRLVVRGGPSLVMGATRVSPPPGSTVAATVLLSASIADRDGDGIPDAIDGCPDAADPAQRDSDGDGRGDVCSPQPDMGAGDFDLGVTPDAAGTDAATDAAADAATDAATDAAGVPDAATVPIVFRSVRGSDISSTTSLSVGLPAGLIAGDVMIAMLALGDTGDPNPAITPPAGWTLIRRLERTDALVVAWYWRVATASEPASQTWTTDVMTHGPVIVLAYSGVHPTMPIVIDSGMQVPASQANYSTPSITPGIAGTMQVVTFSGRGPAFGDWSVPAGTTSRLQQDDGSRRSARLLDRLLPTAGASGALTSTCTPTPDYAFVHSLALRPAQ